MSLGWTRERKFGGELFLFPNEFGAQFPFGGEDKFVFGGEELFVAVEHGVADDGLVLPGTKNNPDRWLSSGPRRRSSYMRTYMSIWPMS